MGQRIELTPKIVHKSMYTRPDEIKDMKFDEIMDDLIPKKKDHGTEEVNDKEENLIENEKNPSSETKPIWNYLFSLPFISLFIVCASKNTTNFLLSCFLKEFGMFYLGDDFLVTLIGIIGAVFGFLVRLNLGPLYAFFGLTGLHVFNLFLEALNAIILWKLAMFKLGFFAFFAVNRMSSGKGKVKVNQRCTVRTQLCVMFGVLGS
jgi:hypothetical protein